MCEPTTLYKEMKELYALRHAFDLALKQGKSSVIETCVGKIKFIPAGITGIKGCYVSVEDTQNLKR